MMLIINSVLQIVPQQKEIAMESLKYDIFSMKSQQLKFQAFFSYLRSFSEAGVETLRKLDSQFHKQVKKKNKEKEILSSMKSILSSYEIFILEVKDSCDFIELPQFGFCIGKTFVQMIKIIKWFLRSWLKNSVKYEASRFRIDTQESKGNDIEEPQASICQFCQQLIKNNPYSRDKKGKRKAVAIDSCAQLNNAKKNFMKQRNHMMEFQEQVLQKYTMKQINSRRFIGEFNEPDIMTRKYAAMKMQFSNKDNVIEQILNELNLKTQSISRFVNHSQIISLEDFKMSSGADYDRIEQQMKVKIAEKYQEAKEKVKQLIKNKLQEYERIRKSKMVDKDVQVSIYEFTEKDKMESKIKQLKSTIRQLKNELESQKMLTQSLKKLLESKSIEFEEEFLNFRKKHILNKSQDSNNSKSFLKSLKSIRDYLDDEEVLKQNISIENFKLEDDCSNKSIQRKHIKNSSILKEKKRKPKKQNSIKFTFQNEQINEQEENLRETIFENNQSIMQIAASVQSTGTQTEQWQPQSSLSPNSSLHNKKFYLINRQNSAKDKLKTKRQDRTKKSADIEQLCKKTTPMNMYSYVKSKVYDSVQTSRPSSGKYRQMKDTQQMNTLVKKLSNNYFVGNHVSDESQSIPSIKRNIDPVFCQISSVNLSSEDVFSLYLNKKNAQNYQCLLYRNSIFSNINPKRNINYQKKFQSSDLEWNFKKEYENSDNFENKIATIIYQQLCSLKRKQKSIYDQLKIFLRAPTYIDNSNQVINLENAKQDEPKDIDLTELKKMINIILRFHLKCLGKEKQALCGHLVQFCKKIGIKFN